MMTLLSLAVDDVDRHMFQLWCEVAGKAMDGYRTEAWPWGPKCSRVPSSQRFSLDSVQPGTLAGYHNL